MDWLLVMPATDLIVLVANCPRKLPVAERSARYEAHASRNIIRSSFVSSSGRSSRSHVNVTHTYSRTRLEMVWQSKTASSLQLLHWSVPLRTT
eukprot:5202471-Amphidinium_carterae.1